MAQCTGKAGAVGYCLGGKLAYLMATRSDAEANVSFYGVGLDDLIGEAGNITRPSLAHVAAKDGFVPPEAQAKFLPVLEKHPQANVHVYPDPDHAFAPVAGNPFNRAP